MRSRGLLSGIRDRSCVVRQHVRETLLALVWVSYVICFSLTRLFHLMFF